jgi:hypothetical protein
MILKILEKGQAIIDNLGDYDLLRQSCQHFALRLLYKVSSVAYQKFRILINISLLPMGGFG